MFREKRSQLLELIIPNTIISANQKVYFQSQPQLQSINMDRKVYIKKIETYSSSHMNGSPLTSGNAVASPAAIINGVLTLNVAGSEDLQYIPLGDMVNLFTDTGAAYTVRNWEGYFFEDLYQVDWSKSYVQLIGIPAATPFSYIFKVSYDYRADNC
jgi:hypothetical protein